MEGTVAQRELPTPRQRTLRCLAWFRQMPATGSIPAGFRFRRGVPWILPCAASSKHHGPMKMAPPRNLKADLRARAAGRDPH